MSDVANQGRTVLFVSHNMSAVLRLTSETIVIDKGRLVMRAPTPEAIDYYLAAGYSQLGERVWTEEEIPASAGPFRPVALRLRNAQGTVVDTLRSIEQATIEVEYRLTAPITGLRVGIYVMNTRGEHAFTSFDVDEPCDFERLTVRPAGHYLSRCTLPADFLNEGRFVLGINASAYRIQRYFQDEQALTFSVDAAGAPGMQWSEPRLGPVRPRLNWEVEDMHA
jgi:lipopolysaccharide transport system ATP-binding protein